MLATARAALAALIIAVVLAGGATVSSPAPANAAGTTGITLGKFGSAQAVAVQRTPTFPACTTAPTYSTMQIFGWGGVYYSPYSDATNGAVDLGDRYLMVQANPDTSNTRNPWRLTMYSAAGDELRWSGSSWVTAPGGGFTTEQLFSASGQIYGVSSAGFLYVSELRDFGMFITPGGALTYYPYTYTPSASLNDCISYPGGYRAVGSKLDDLPVTGEPVTGSTGGGGAGSGDTDPLALTGATLGDGTVGSSYSASAAATGGEGSRTYTVSSGSLPDGLSLNSETGAITGTPTVPGDYSFEITVTAGSETVTAPFSITIDAAPAELTDDSVTSDPPGGAGLDAPYSHTIEVDNTGSVTFEVTDGALPPGLTLDPTTGVISGTPTEPGTYTFTVTISNGTSQIEVPYTMPVWPPVSLTGGALPGASAGAVYDETLTVEGGGPATWSVTAGELPEGVTLDPATGRLSGMPRVTGSYSFTVTVTDGYSTASAQFTLAVAPPSDANSLINLAFTGFGLDQGTWTSAAALPFALGLALIAAVVAYRRRIFAPNRALQRWMLVHPSGGRS